jgi:hypothetical protein
MGSWGVGPFDNDTADDFAIEVDEAPEGDQLRMLRAALLAVDGSEDSVDAFDALPAVAAAALVARDLPGGEEFNSGNYGKVRSLPRMPKDLVLLAADVVDRLIGCSDELNELLDWQGREDEWLALMQRLRNVLYGPPSGEQVALW